MISASTTLEEIRTILRNGNTSPIQLNFIQNFIEKNNNNYGALASLDLASYYAHNGKDDGNIISIIEKQLKKSLSKASESNLQAIIKLRLSHIKLEKNDVDSALKILSSITQKGWKVLVEDTYGDAQMIKGNDQAARIAYMKVLQNDSFPALQAITRIKLNNLSQ